MPSIEELMAQTAIPTPETDADRRRRLLGPASLLPGGAAPPPGYLAGNLGGLEVPGGVSGTPIPLGPSTPLGPGGPISTPVSNPARAPGPVNGPLEALREQLGTINQLTGTAPQAPQVNHIIEPGSPTAGLAQLGGRMIGNQTPSHVGVDPAAALQASIFHTQDAGHSANRQALLSQLATMGNQAIQGGHLSLEAMRTLGIPGQSGSIANAARSVEQQGRAADLLHGPDAQNAAAFNTFAQQRVANGGSLEEARREWVNSGMRLPQFAGGAALSPSSFGTPGSAATAPAGTPVVNANGPVPIPDQSPASRLNQVYQTIQRRQSGVGPGQGNQARITDPSSGITDMVHTLGEGFVNTHLPEVMNFIADRFGGGAANEWFTHRSSIIGRPSPQEQAIRIIQNAANARQPGTVGNSSRNEETGGAARMFPWESNAFGLR